MNGLRNVKPLPEIGDVGVVDVFVCVGRATENVLLARRALKVSAKRVLNPFRFKIVFNGFGILECDFCLFHVAKITVFDLSANFTLTKCAGTGFDAPTA